MRVLHLPLESGGQVGEICQQLRALGHTAVGYNWRHTYLNYDHTLLHSDAYEMANSLEAAIDFFDLFHYHTGYTIFKDKSDILRVLEAGKAVVMHHRGNDVRIPSLAGKGPGHTNPYVYTGDSQEEAVIKRNLAFFSAHISTAIVQDFELYDYVAGYYRHVRLLPRLINLQAFRPAEPQETGQADPGRRPVVVHAPTSRAFKGTEDIVRTVERLQRELSFDFVLLEKQSRAAAIAGLRAADIVIDQVRCGMYGNVSVEGMALGKAVVCYLRPDIRDRLPAELPIVSASPDTLYDELKALLLDEERRRLLGGQGRSYAERHHDAAKTAERLLDIYRTVLSGGENRGIG